MQRTKNGHVIRALTIAGSDSGGGAGIQADLKTFAAFQVYGMSVLTGVTAQNTVGVQGVHYLDPEFVEQQLASVFDDLGADALKTGMLGSEEITRTVARFLRNRQVDNLVVDPVMIAKGGQALIDDQAKQTVLRELLPLATVVTPNIPEAEELCGYAIQSWQDSHRAARDLVQMGAQAVVIKGGHAQQEWLLETPWSGVAGESSAVDVVFDGTDFTYFVTPRIESAKTHGTGCTFSSAIVAGLATGHPLLDAIAAAKSFIYEAIASGANWDVGAGHGPTDHSVVANPASGMRAGRAYLWQSPPPDSRSNLRPDAGANAGANGQSQSRPESQWTAIE